LRGPGSSAASGPPPGARQLLCSALEQQRQRLQKLGVDPSALVPDPRQFERARLEAMLLGLHRAGMLDDDELAAKRAALDKH